MAKGITISCVVVLLATIGVLAMPRLRSALGFAPADQRSYQPGDRMDVSADVYRTTDRTLVVFARSTCPACAKTSPFLKELTATLKGRDGVRVVLLSVGVDRNAELAYATALGLDPARVLLVNPVGLKARHIPALVWVDRDGTVLDSWEGTPTVAQQELILRIVTGSLP